MPEESWKNILIYLANIEIYLIGCDNYHVDQYMSFTDEVLYYQSLSEKSFKIKISNKDGNKIRYEEIYITIDGMILYGYNRLYIGTSINEVNNYDYINNLIAKYAK